MALFILLSIMRWAFLEETDALAFDFVLRVRGPRAPDPRVVIVAIDDGSLQAISTWPWPRDTLGRLIETILDSQPAVVGIDLLLTDALDRYPKLAGSDRTVLAASLGNSLADHRLFWQEPENVAENSGPVIGHIHANKDLNGVCRSIPFAIRFAGKRRWAFSLEIARLFLKVPKDEMRFEKDFLRIGATRIPRLRSPLDDGLDSLEVLPPQVGDYLIINSRGATRTFPYISAAEVLKGEKSIQRRLRNKIVLVGATSYSLGDHLATSFSGPSETPGIEIHANALDTVLNERFIRTLDEPGALLLLSGLLIWTWLIFGHWSGRWVVILFIGTILGCILLPMLFMLSNSFWIPMVSAVSTVVMTGTMAQLVRVSELNRQLNRRFSHLSSLLEEHFPSNASQPEHTGIAYRRRSLEWKLGVLGEATESALKLAQVKEEMLTFVSHELKTPLTSIRGFAELLMEPGRLAPEDRLDSLRLIRDETQRLGRMVNHYLDLVRLEHGGTPVNLQRHDLKKILQRTGSLLESQFHQKEMKLDGIETIPSTAIRGDADLLTHVFLNLLGNAVKYSPRHTTVSVGVSVDESYVRVFIRDQGYGISKKDRAKLFKKFFRGSQPEDLPPGSGLGLAFVRVAVEKHEGKVGVDSQPGHGSTFTVWLPLEGSGDHP